jgi:predicted DNA-binding protein (UPF0251 family)
MAWEQIFTTHGTGMLSIKIIPEMRLSSVAHSLAADQLSTMAPSASRATNTTYSIDNVAALVCDIDQAMKATLTYEQFSMLRKHHLYGYTKAEVAEMMGVTPQAIGQMFARCYKRVAAWLEKPKPAISEPMYPRPSYETQKRKYASLPNMA